MDDATEHNLCQREKAHEALNSLLNHALVQNKSGAVSVRIPIVCKNGNGPRLGNIRVVYEQGYE